MAANSKLKSVALYTQGLNTGVEYGVREDGVVFYREKYWNDRYRTYSTTKWQRDSYWEQEGTFCDLPVSVEMGFALNGRHLKVSSARLRLPQDS